MKNSLVIFLLFLMIGCANIEPRRPVNPKPSTTIYKQAIEESKKLNKIEEARILAFIKNDSLSEYIQSSSGFWYKYIKKVNEEQPTPNVGDDVVFEYNIKDLRDSIIYGKEELGVKSYKVDKEDLITGLQKGIKLMKIGETITFVFPSYNAFGIVGDQERIGINETIKSTVTLINIK
ncbi:gliding motility-associated peptidyl-prolyl isomerase GldI [Polaribacter porphyrae]|uniref:Peptidyl-prolyl cis-trans isomerase n=1 Tax=Polaribacter porphyrae TaxID=1137780 RepID=A0A2S7WLM0_9FLAO|nr:gliding motility-associated peptidyl-prolyl isomerase GldI [Polaribacter porphyrae]PQJ78202.1 gliding motility-associated peptidyl-prolyl isomerase GldI [Polaribacter porphyrae]